MTKISDRLRPAYIAEQFAEDAERPKSLKEWARFHGRDREHFGPGNFLWLARVLRYADHLDTSSRIMELGCGNGAASCFIAGLGYQVIGIDVRQAAIQQAREAAEQARLPIRFEQTDLCRLSVRAFKGMDLIVDGHCLHCIVRRTDRRSALKKIHGVLAPGGIFALRCLCMSLSMEALPAGHLDDNGVLWQAANDQGPWREHKTIDGVLHIPRRRYVLPGELAEELVSAGFKLTRLNERHGVVEAIARK